MNNPKPSERPMKTFAYLVKDLLKDRDWSENDLAKRAGMTRSQIEQITSGSKKKFEIEDLMPLAKAFELTSVMRREFFLAAIVGLDSSAIARPIDNHSNREYPDAHKVKTILLKRLASLRVPAFITDVYCDVVAVNEMCIKFLGVPESLLAEANTIPGGGNTMRFVFDKRSGYKDLMGDEHWRRNLWMNMNHFVCGSLRYRADEAYQEIRDALLKDLHLFKDYWDRFENELDDHYMDIDPIEFEYFDPVRKNTINIHYLITQSQIYTTRGELMLTAYLPASPDTALVFANLDQQVDKNIADKVKKMKQAPRDTSLMRIRTLCPWPEKKLWKKQDE